MRLALHLLAGTAAAALAYTLVMLASIALAFMAGLPVLAALEAGRWIGAAAAAAIGLLVTANFVGGQP